MHTLYLTHKCVVKHNNVSIFFSSKYEVGHEFWGSIANKLCLVLQKISQILSQSTYLCYLTSRHSDVIEYSHWLIPLLTIVGLKITAPRERSYIKKEDKINSLVLSFINLCFPSWIWFGYFHFIIWNTYL